jgi:putative sugar O-methyltransferase
MVNNQISATKELVDSPPGYLTPSEQKMLKRLFTGGCTMEEGLAFYSSVVGNGRSFLPAWEIRVLELGLARHPDRQDMRERLKLLTSELNPEDTTIHQAIVTDAKARLAAAIALPNDGLPSHGVRWGAYAERTRNSIATLNAPTEILHFAQTKVNFEHRGHIGHEGKFTDMYERELILSFPQYSDSLAGFADIANSAPDTTYEYKGRLISNILFYLSRIVLSCLSHLPTPPNVILELGGGYGAPARLWMKNPISNPRCYLIVDMPESLFFADVFLRTEFGDDAVHYLTSGKPLEDEALEKHRFILCPLPFLGALENLPVDIVINTGSLQEMSEEWVDFYSAWLDRQRCSWFYSLNYFGQPINALMESGNVFSPRLSANWTARHLRWNPAFIRMQADRDYLEALYEKGTTALDPIDAKRILRLHMERSPTGDGLVECFDLIRRNPEPAVMLEVLAYAMRMPSPPKEALWLATRLLDTELSAEDRAKVENWRNELDVVRASGREATYQ